MFVLCFILALIQVSYEQLSALPTWIGNPYLETDLYQVITDFQTISQSGGANITFQQTYSIPPKVAFAITSYSGNDGLFDEDFYMQTVRVTETLAETNIFMQGITNIRIFYVMYLAVHPDFQYHLNTFNDIEANYSTGILSLYPIDQYTNETRFFVNYINYTQLCSTITTNFNFFGNDMSKNKIAAYLSGIFNYVRSNPRDYPEVKFDVTTEAVNASFFKLQVQVNPTYRIDLLRLSFITMDIQNIEGSRAYTIIYTTQRYYFDQDYYIPLQEQFFGDVFIGMLDYNTQTPACTIDFNLIFQPNNSRIVVKKSVPHSASSFPNCGLKSTRIVTFYMKTWFCPVPFYYFNLVTDMCEDYCASYLYGNITAGQCKPCPTGCTKCDPIDPDTCTECDSSIDFRHMVNGSCQCIIGYYELISPTNTCVSCILQVPNCASCQLSPSFTCGNCLVGWFLKPDGYCELCTMIGCVSCISLLQCVICDNHSGYTLVSNKTCQICPISCSCDGYYLPSLIDSMTGNQFCRTVCGDGLKRQFQECDDGNFVSQDGCSSQCKVEEYWQCSNSTELTCCVISSQNMYIKVDDISKTKGQNSFEIKLSLFPHLGFLTSQKLLNSADLSLTGIATTKSEMRVEQIQKIKLKYSYGFNIEKKACNISLSLMLTQQNNPNCSMTVGTSMVFYPDSSNNLPLIFFSQENYAKQDQINKMTDFILYSSYAVLFLSALPCKIVGLQLFGVLQLAYFSLAQMEDLNLMLVPLIKLGASNGFNPNLFQSKEQLPNKINYIDYNPLFINNCGLMLGVLVLIVLAGLACYMIGYFGQKILRLSSVSRRLLKQGLLTLLVFNSLNFSFAVGIHFKYASPNDQAYALNSVVAVLSLILPVCVALGLIFTDAKQFGQFKDKFKPQTSCQLYFVVTIFYRYALGYYIAVQAQYSLSSLVIIFFSLLFIVYNFINLPFSSTLHNYRANVCHLSQLAILIVANYYQSMKATTNLQQKSIIFSPAYIDIAVILSSICVSVLGLFYQVFRFIRSFKNKIKIKNSSAQLSEVKSLNEIHKGQSLNQINQTEQIDKV